MYIASEQGAYNPQGTSFEVNKNFLSLRSSVASFKSKTTIVSENPLFYLFPIQKHKGPNLSRSTQGRHLNNLGRTAHSMLHTKFQGHRPFGSGEEEFFKVFTIYGHGGHLDHVTRIV